MACQRVNHGRLHNKAQGAASGSTFELSCRVMGMGGACGRVCDINGVATNLVGQPFDMQEIKQPALSDTNYVVVVTEWK